MSLCVCMRLSLPLSPSLHPRGIPPHLSTQNMPILSISQQSKHAWCSIYHYCCHMRGSMREALWSGWVTLQELQHRPTSPFTLQMMMISQHDHSHPAVQSKESRLKLLHIKKSHMMKPFSAPKPTHSLFPNDLINLQTRGLLVCNNLIWRGIWGESREKGWKSSAAWIAG